MLSSTFLTFMDLMDLEGSDHQIFFDVQLHFVFQIVKSLMLPSHMSIGSSVHRCEVKSKC